MGIETVITYRMACDKCAKKLSLSDSTDEARFKAISVGWQVGPYTTVICDWCLGKTEPDVEVEQELRDLRARVKELTEDRDRAINLPKTRAARIDILNIERLTKEVRELTEDRSVWEARARDFAQQIEVAHDNHGGAERFDDLCDLAANARREVKGWDE